MLGLVYKKFDIYLTVFEEQETFEVKILIHFFVVSISFIVKNSLVCCSCGFLYTLFRTFSKEQYNTTILCLNIINFSSWLSSHVGRLVERGSNAEWSISLFHAAIE